MLRRKEGFREEREGEEKKERRSHRRNTRVWVREEEPRVQGRRDWIVWEVERIGMRMGCFLFGSSGVPALGFKMSLCTEPVWTSNHFGFGNGLHFIIFCQPGQTSN